MILAAALMAEIIAKIKLLLFPALIVVLVLTPSIYAHHGSAFYDKKTTLTLVGTVTELTLANPHSYLAFDAKDEKGDTNHWVVEFGVLHDLVEEGWTKDTLKPGDQVKVHVHPRKDGSFEGIAVKEITYADGRPVPLTAVQRPHVMRW